MKSHSSGFSDLQDDYKLFLLSKLTNAVQNLLNDNENPVLQVDFCRRIEMLVFYGVKSRTFKWKNEPHVIWNLLKEISPNHIIEDIMLLKSVKTDVGRIRAWIRVTINESTLQSYLHLLTDHKLTRRYYDNVSIFNDPQMVAKLFNLISMITDNSYKVLFNCDSFDYEVAPSATDLSTPSSPISRTPISRTSSKSSLDADKSSTIIDNKVSSKVELLVSPSCSSSSVTSLGSQCNIAELAPANTDLEEQCTSVEGTSIDPASLGPPSTTDPSSLLVSPEAITSLGAHNLEQAAEVAVNISSERGSQTQIVVANDAAISALRIAIEVEANDSTHLTVNEKQNSAKISRVSPDQFLSSPEPCPIHEDEDPIANTFIPLTTSSQSADPGNILNSVPLTDPIVSAHILNQPPLLQATSEPTLNNVTDNVTDSLTDSSSEQLLCSSLPMVMKNESLEGAGSACEVSAPQSFPTDLVTSSPYREKTDDNQTNDMLPGTPKDDVICDNDIFELRQKMGNSLQTSRDKLSGAEMIAQKVSDEEDDPYGDASSAKSLSSHTSPLDSECSHDNIMQYIDPISEERSVPISENTDHTPNSYEPHSLGSSLYRLFSKAGSDGPLKASQSNHLSNLAQIHSAVVDDVPVTSEDTTSARSYLMGAGRATASYTYQSANQWLSLSKDMWWWLQRRVIPEHECQHPTPPQSDQLSGSPNSSLLEICTEHCPCCNAIVIDYCNNEGQDRPISNSCPPFSNLVQHMQQQPNSVRHTYPNDSKDYFNIDILENPAPPLTTLNAAIELQKERTKQVLDDETKKKEVDLLINLRKKKHELTDDSSDTSDLIVNILGHSLTKSSKLSGYCSKCAGAIYPRLLTAYTCTACNIMLHKTCINEVSRHCSLANREALKMVTDIAPAHGLHEQNYCCYDCGIEIAYSATKVHVCDYNGRYYCSECHKKTLVSLPARILHNWDFRPKQIALQSHEILSYLLDKEYLNIEKINPQLFDSVSVLSQIRDLREKMILYKAHFVQCNRALREGQFLKIKSRQHFIDTSKVYTIQDLVDAHSGSLLTEVQGVVSDYDAHYAACDTCSNQKFLCSVCAVPPLISPFRDQYSIAQCSQCHGVMHRPCFNMSHNCPYCLAPLVNL